MQRASSRSRKSNNHAIHNSIGDIRDHAQGMARDVRDIGEAVKDVLFEKFTDMLKRALSFGERSQEAAKEAAADAREAVEERIQAHPYGTILVAAGVGVAVGMLLRRR